MASYQYLQQRNAKKRAQKKRKKNNNTARRLNKVQVMLRWKDEHEEGKTQMVQLVKVICATRRQTFAPTNQKASGKQVVKLLEVIHERHSGEKSHRSNQLLRQAIWRWAWKWHQPLLNRILVFKVTWGGVNEPKLD